MSSQITKSLTSPLYQNNAFSLIMPDKDSKSITPSLVSMSKINEFVDNRRTNLLKEYEDKYTKQIEDIIIRKSSIEDVNSNNTDVENNYSDADKVIQVSDSDKVQVSDNSKIIQIPQSFRTAKSITIIL